MEDVAWMEEMAARRGRERGREGGREGKRERERERERMCKYFGVYACPRGRRCVLVDDVIITGSTMIKCGQLLKDLGAVSVWVYATHAQVSFWTIIGLFWHYTRSLLTLTLMAMGSVRG